MQKILAKTLFVGSKIVQLSTCGSTNTVALELLHKNEATEGTVVTTLAQSRGRGQRGNVWEAEEGLNITLSVVFTPGFLAPGQQFFLNMAISLACLEFGQRFLPEPLKIKWPNDLFFEDKKWGGILIENSISGSRLQHAVVGVGINVNQRQFKYPRATSFAMETDTQFEVAELIGLLLGHLEKRYLELRQLNLHKLRHDYLQHLYRYQEPGVFEVEGREVTGQILGVDETGRLGLQIERQVHYFGSKQISYVFST